jgi:hypothetical protein
LLLGPQLAREFGVATSVISTDIKRLFARDRGRAAKVRPVPRRREVRMPEKLSLRLSRALHRDLRQAARHHRMTPSAFIRTALQQVLEPSTPASVLAAQPPHDALEGLVMTLPYEVQQAIRQAITATGLPLGSVLKALIVAACQQRTPPQLTHENFSVETDNCVSPGVGLRSIPPAR